MQIRQQLAISCCLKMYPIEYKMHVVSVYDVRMIYAAFSGLIMQLLGVCLQKAYVFMCITIFLFLIYCENLQPG